MSTTPRAAAILLALAAGCSTYKDGDSEPAGESPRTLWQICWDADGDWLLPSDLPPHEPECTDPSVVKWPHGQVRVATLAEVPELEPHLSAAIAQWNAWLGWPMFVRTEIAYDVAIVCMLPHILWAGMASLKIEADVMVGAVFLYGYHPDEETKIILHELGHLLGLAHDVDPESLMHQGGSASVPQRADIEALRDLYGK